MNMKKTVCYVLVGIILIFAVICTAILVKHYTNNADKADVVSTGTLYINGKEITNENVRMHHIKNSSYAELPFIVILENLGFKVEWSNQNISNISYNNTEYNLNIQEITLFKKNESTNLISPAPGNRRRYKTLYKELVLDDITIKCALLFMGKKINIDFDNSIVYVTNIDE